ncbi:MAG: transposase family protein [Planctomycetota bacterium]|nr:transposase family protein [Planctomycetota bacterium]
MDTQATAKFPRAFEQMPDPRAANRRHKRIDALTIALFAVICGADGWAAMAQYGRAKRAWLRTFLDLPHGIERCSIERHYDISLLDRRTQAKRLAKCVRGRGSVANNWHWPLDLSFREDERRIRQGHGAENFSRRCRMGLNLVKQEKRQKTGIGIKRQNGGWDNDYLLKVLLA